MFNDWRSIGVGEVIDGRWRDGAAGLGAVLDGRWRRRLRDSNSACGRRLRTLPPSSSVIAILKVPSTITTTLAPTSSERIFEVMVDGSLLRLGSVAPAS